MSAPISRQAGPSTPGEVRQARVALGLTRAELSRKAGYSSRYLSAVEAGHFPLNPYFLERVTAALQAFATDRPILVVKCLCGCGETFVTEPRREYVNREHQVRGYNIRFRRKD